MPAGAGVWPAFWLAPSTLDWPPEIDILEMAGEQSNILYTTVHTHANGLTGPVKVISYKTPVADMTTGFHTYGMLWTDTHIAFYFDDRRVLFTTTPPDLHQPMYVIINLAIGGMGGKPNAATHFPAIMLVKSVCIHRLEGRL
jgi:beta-glucanase (GH16 family)